MNKFIQNLESHPLFKAASRVLRIPVNRLRQVLIDNEKLVKSLEHDSGNRSLNVEFNKDTFKDSKKNTVVFVDQAKQLLNEEIRSKLCHILHEETFRKVLLIEFVEDGGEYNLADLGKKIPAANGYTNSNSFFKSEKEVAYLKLKITLGDDHQAFSRLLPFLETCYKTYTFVLLYFAGDSIRRTLFECAIHFENIYITLSQRTKDFYAINLLIREVSNRLAKDTRKIKPLLILEKGESPQNLQLINDKIGIPLSGIIRTQPNDLKIPNGPDYDREVERRYNAQFRRIAREIGRCRIGLALSPGSAKGLAHIGVIQVLEENGIDIDVISATSMGAYVAAHWAYGYNGRDMERLSRGLEKRFGLLELLDFVLPPRRAFFLGRKIKNRLRQALGHARFADLSIPLRIVASNINTMEPEVFSEGDVVSAVRASCTIPGVFVPMEINGETYIDGGVTNPLPVDVLEEMGIENIIAVSTVLSPSYMRECASTDKHNGDRNFIKGFFQFVNRHLNYFADGNIMDTVMRSMEGGQIHIVERDLLRADVVLQPITCDSEWYEYNKPGKYIACGRQEAERQLNKICSLLNQKVEVNENINVN